MYLTLILFAFVYVAVLYCIVYKLRDIRDNPKYYNRIEGFERYRKSFWYEKKIKRYGAAYYATLLLGIPFLIFFLQAYFYLSLLLHSVSDSIFPSDFFYFGGISIIFYSIPLIYSILMHVNRPIFVAARLYWIPNEEWFEKGKYHLAWRNVYRWLLVCSILCLPFLLLGTVL